MSPGRSLPRRLLRWLGALGAVVFVALAGAAGWLYVEMRGSLAQLDGEAVMRGASGAITIERDALGVPTITAATRADVARGLGFLHAQDRFFQMDLARRRAAGELSELFGPAALSLDKRARVLRLRARAQRAIELASPEERALMRAYVEGVNAGLKALATKPPEYLLLRMDPKPWAVEDSMLVVASMFLTLNDSEALREARRAAVYEALPKPLADFVTTTASGWETPLVGGMHPVPPIPGPEVFDLRTAPRVAPLPPVKSGAEQGNALIAMLAPQIEDGAVGSNNWAVSGRVTADGGAIIADDMHLSLSVPNIWYRASMAWTDSRPRRITGVTLPGVPSLVAGSNGDVAWGFTNSDGDWSDLVIVERDPSDANRYRTPAGMQSFQNLHETIKVKGGEDVKVDLRETIWGPIVGHDAHGHDYADAWIALRDGGMNMKLGGVETASTLEQLFEVAAQAGIPPQNVTAAQRDGRIGWTIAGRIPHRVGFDGWLPSSWADGTRGWNGWLDADAYPRVIDPPDGRIVTANNRLVDGAALQTLGDGGYDPGARARQISDDLKAIARANVGDMMTVHLDDRAVFLARWRDLLLQTLSAPGVRETEARRELKRVVSTNWTGRASADSAAYRIVRDFRTHVAELAFAPLLERVRQFDPAYSLANTRINEGPLWALVTQRPLHLLDPKLGSWDDLLLGAADLTAVSAKDAGGLAGYVWGKVNTVRIRHPFSAVVPVLGPLLDMPTDELPGDANMPRVQGPAFGASERFAVSPGREKDGYFHMPTGQSGHPLSPHYRDSNPAWVAGAPTPFLPGPVVHTLTLRP
jgi:penicillin G amidase